MELNRKELKKIARTFNTISSRMMRVVYEEYIIILKKFLNYIESTEIIMEYILSGGNDYNAEENWKLVTNKEGYMFEFGPSIEEETYEIYRLLKYIDENIKSPALSFHRVYGESKWQDNVKQFNNRVVLVLITNISDYLMKVGIDMGMDENVVWNVNGGQINIASGNSTINAIQNNEVEISQLEQLVKDILDNIGDLNKKDAETIVDSVEMIKEELMKSEPKGRIVSNGIKLLAPIISTVNGMPLLISNIQKLIEFASPYIQ